MADALGQPPSVAESQQLGRAAVMAMLTIACRCPAGAVLDSTWYPYTLPSRMNYSATSSKCDASGRGS